MTPIFFTRLNFTGLSQVIINLGSLQAVASARLNLQGPRKGQWETSVHISPGHETSDPDDLEYLVHEACREAREARDLKQLINLNLQQKA